MRSFYNQIVVEYLSKYITLRGGILSFKRKTTEGPRLTSFLPVNLFFHLGVAQNQSLCLPKLQLQGFLAQQDWVYWERIT